MSKQSQYVTTGNQRQLVNLFKHREKKPTIHYDLKKK